MTSVDPNKQGNRDPKCWDKGPWEASHRRDDLNRGQDIGISRGRLLQSKETVTTRALMQVFSLNVGGTKGRPLCPGELSERKHSRELHWKGKRRPGHVVKRKLARISYCHKIEQP